MTLDFKTRDVRALLAAGGLASGLTTVAATVAPVAAVAAGGLSLAAVLVLARAQAQAERRRQTIETQALLDVYSLLSPRRPLPPMVGYACTPELARLLVEIVLDRRPEHVVEAGGGVSTLVLGYALERAGRGRVVSLDHDDAYAARTARLVREHALGEHVAVVHAPLVRYTEPRAAWYATSALPSEPIDLLVLDGPPRRSGPLARHPAIPLLRDRLARGATIVLDDANRADERESVRRWRHELGRPVEVEHVATARGVAILRTT